MNEPVVRAVAEADGALLARRAAKAVADQLAGRPADGRLPGELSLRALGATFVTLETNGTLLGCVGTLDAARPRYLDAMRNAVRAASDPRLPPVTAVQWPVVDVTVSVLSDLERLEAEDAADLIERLRPGVDGLVLTDGQRRATFLPSVWHKIMSPERFVTALLHKGGWASAGGARAPGTAPTPVEIDWLPDLVALRYTAAEFRNPAPRPHP